MQHASVDRLSKALRRLAGASSPALLLDWVVAEAVELAGGADGCLIVSYGDPPSAPLWRFDPSGRRVEIAPDFVASLELQTSTGGTPRLLQAEPEWLAALGCQNQAVLWAPFCSAAQFGGGFLIPAARLPMSGESLALLELFACQAGAALHNAFTVERLQEEITYLQNHDDLVTKLPNRRYFKRRLNQVLPSAPDKEGPLGLLFLDLDHFDRVNQELGHSAGDRFLFQAADRLREWLDEGAGAFIGRVGGDEFAILLHPITGLAVLAEAAANIVRGFQQPLLVPPHRRVITASVGAVLGPVSGGSAELLLERAERAMYDAKSRGRNAATVDDSSGADLGQNSLAL